MCRNITLPAAADYGIDQKAHICTQTHIHTHVQWVRKCTRNHYPSRSGGFSLNSTYNTRTHIHTHVQWEENVPETIILPAAADSEIDLEADVRELEDMIARRR